MVIDNGKSNLKIVILLIETLHYEQVCVTITLQQILILICTY